MPSPFPGMNPHLEQAYVWHDFRESFIPFARDLISTQALSRYFVRIDEHIYVHELSAEERRFLGRADVAVTPESGMAPATGGSTIAAPHEVHLATAVDIERRSSLEIPDRDHRQVVTILELLSPADKKGPMIRRIVAA